MTSRELFVFSMASVSALFLGLSRKREKTRNMENQHDGVVGDFSGADSGGDGGGGD